MADQQGQALQDFNDGFIDGYRGDKRQKNRGGVYLRAFAKGKRARIDHEAGGPDMGDTPVARPRPRKTAVAKVA